MINYDEFVSVFQSVSKAEPVPEEEILYVAEVNVERDLKGKKEAVYFEIVIFSNKNNGIAEFKFIAEAVEDTQEEWKVRYLGMS